MSSINTSTLKFLKDIEQNNNRPWFGDNKPKYEVALANVKEFVNEVMAGMQRKDDIESMKVFRIYRDVRFSKNKAPYKNNFGIGWKRATASLRGGYYLQIQPGGKSFVAGGFWNPNPADLKRIREEFVVDDKPIRKIVKAKRFVDNFGTLEGDAVKTSPKGFDKEHPAIDLIRMKQFVVRRRFSDKQVKDPGFAKEVVKTFETMRPYFNYMSEVLTTNLNGEKVI